MKRHVTYPLATLPSVFGAIPTLMVATEKVSATPGVRHD